MLQVFVDVHPSRRRVVLPIACLEHDSTALPALAASMLHAAVAVKDALQSCGFEVAGGGDGLGGAGGVLLNPRVEDVRTALTTHMSGLRRDDVLVVYACGYGRNDGNDVYLPVRDGTALPLFPRFCCACVAHTQSHSVSMCLWQVPLGFRCVTSCVTSSLAPSASATEPCYSSWMSSTRAVIVALTRRLRGSDLGSGPTMGSSTLS